MHLIFFLILQIDSFQISINFRIHNRLINTLIQNHLLLFTWIDSFVDTGKIAEFQISFLFCISNAVIKIAGVPTESRYFFVDFSDVEDWEFGVIDVLFRLHFF